MKLSQLPNLISLVRLAATVPVVVLFWHERYGLALAVFALAGASDALDGYLAKRYGWGSRLGGILDAVADKVLVIGVFLVLAWARLIPGWLVLAVVVRDAVIGIGAAAYHLRIQPLEPRPTRVSKLNTLLQILLVLAVMWGEAAAPLPDPVRQTLFLCVLATTVVSGGEYVGAWGLKAWRALRAPTHPE